jgi:hypothetical protein
MTTLLAEPAKPDVKPADAVVPDTLQQTADKLFGESTDAAAKAKADVAKAAADASAKAVADKTAADAAAKATADLAEKNKGLTPEQIKANAEKEAADKAVADKAIADRLVADKAQDEAYKTIKADGVTPEAVADLAKFAKENGIAPAAAQKLLDRNVAQTKAAQEAHLKNVNAWGDKLKSDAEFGGNKFTENAELARRALADPRVVGTDAKEVAELIDGLEKTGGGNWPPLVKIFARIGRLMKEDGFVAGSKQATAPQQKSLAERMFGGT